MASSLRVNSIIPSSGNNVAIGTAGGTISYNASVSGVSTFSQLNVSSQLNVGIGGTVITTSVGGNVGVGTDNPVLGKCEIHCPGTTNHLILKDTTNNWVSKVQVSTGGTFTIKSGDTEHLRIDTSGRVTTPYQPAFAAYDNTGTTRTSGTVIWNVKLFDRQNNYNTSDGRFTAPVSGVYLFRADFRSSSTSGAPIIDIVTSNGYITRHEETAGIVNVYHQSLCMVCYMNANDYAYVQVSGGSIRMDTNQVDNFAGYLVG